MATERPVFNRMFIGYNRTGKSSMARKYGNLWVMHNPGKTVAGHDPQRRFKGIINPKYQLFGYDDNKDWWNGYEGQTKEGRYPIKNLRNALFAADDYRGLNQYDTTQPSLLRLMEFRAEYAIDCLFVCHSPGLVLSRLSYYISHWHIFYTKGSQAAFDKKTENFEECTLAAEIMRAYAQEKPEIVKQSGQFFDEKNYDHTFPHIIIDAVEGTLIPQHMDKQWLETNQKRFTNLI